MKHPSESTLALYAGKELSLLSRWKTALHVRRCEVCGRRAGEFQNLREWMRAREDELPAGLNWEEMAGEIKANVRLGLAAGRCVAEMEQPGEPVQRLWWPARALVFPVLLLVVAGWVVQSLHPPLVQPGPEIVLQTGAAGIGMEKDGRGFTLLQPADRNVLVSVRGEVAGARYVDAETDQVTISHVYAQ